MDEKDILNYKVLAGSDPIKILKAKPFKIFEEEVLLLLSEISNKILNNERKIKNKEDFIGFGFWARKANLKRLKIIRKNNNDLRIGRGPVLHIAPSNITANALFTFAFGLISGCPSIIRISSRILGEYDYIFDVINKISQSKKFVNSFSRFSFISYDVDSNLNEFFCKKVKARVIWGGNHTIEKFKCFSTSPNCIDLIFPNRDSSSIISTSWLNSSSETELKKISDLYARDVGLYSQQACSSPRSLILLKDDNLNAKEKLRNFLYFCDKSLNHKKGVSPSQGLFNLKTSIDIFIKNPSLKLFFKGTNLCVFSLAKNQASIKKDIFLKDSCLILYEINLIDDVTKFLRKDNQTLICIGISEDTKKEIAFKAALDGTDRVVEPGNALSMDIFWDGYDIVNFLSRLIIIN